MTISKPRFHRDAVEIIRRDTAHQGFFRMEQLRLRHRLFQGGWSPSIDRELFVRGPAVAVVLYDPRHDLIGLVEQFRVGALDEPGGPWCLEVVAGIIDANETPAQVAEREVAEETGLTLEHLHYICNYLSSPGGSDEKLHLYCGLCDLTHAGGIHGLDSEEEDIQVWTFAADEVFAELHNGRLNNAATLICLQWLQLNRDSIRSGQETGSVPPSP